MSGPEVVMTLLLFATLAVLVAVLVEDYQKWNRAYEERQARRERMEYDKARHPSTLAQYGRGNLRVVAGGRDE